MCLGTAPMPTGPNPDGLMGAALPPNSELVCRGKGCMKAVNFTITSVQREGTVIFLGGREKPEPL